MYAKSFELHTASFLCVWVQGNVTTLPLLLVCKINFLMCKNNFYKYIYIYIYIFKISTPLLLISFQSIHIQGQCFLNAHFILAFLAPFNSSWCPKDAIKPLKEVSSPCSQRCAELPGFPVIYRTLYSFLSFYFSMINWSCSDLSTSITTFRKLPLTYTTFSI